MHGAGSLLPPVHRRDCPNLFKTGFVMKPSLHMWDTQILLEFLFLFYHSYFSTILSLFSAISIMYFVHENTGKHFCLLFNLVNRNENNLKKLIIYGFFLANQKKLLSIFKILSCHSFEVTNYLLARWPIHGNVCICYICSLYISMVNFYINFQVTYNIIYQKRKIWILDVPSWNFRFCSP